MAHYLEHMLLKGTKKRLKSKNISNNISWIAILLTLILFVLVSFFDIPAILALIVFLTTFIILV